MNDRYIIGFLATLCLVPLEVSFWWFPGLTIAFFIGRWSMS